MKKILTILAATATMFAFGAGNLDTTISQGADFEAFTAGNAFSAGLNDSAQQSAPFYWYTADADAANIISNYTGSGTDVPIASRPEKFADDENSKYLQVETTGKLYRTVKNNGGSDDFTTNVTAIYAHSLTDAPIYLDTLVKFTAADSVFGDDALENGDKIAIEYVEHESEGPGDDTVTNFVVRAGYVTGSGNGATVVQTNYFVAPPSNFDKDAWHRLTVRTISDVGDGTIGFVIYLDQALLKYSADVAAGDAAFVGGLNNDVSSKFYNDEDAAVGHALFPSVVRTGAAKTTISAAAFSGNGSLDDVVFTTTKPEFIQETALVTVRWDTNKITAVTLNSTGLTQAQWEVGEIAITPVNNSVVFSVTYAEGYELGTCSVTPATSGGWDGANAFTNLKAGAVCDIVAMKPYFEVNGAKFDNFTDALTAATGATAADRGTIKLLATYSDDIFVSEGYVTIDLAGKTIAGKTAAAIMNAGADLYITNSTVEIGHVAPGTSAEAILLGGGSTTIYDGWIDGEVYDDSGATATLALVGGYYLDAAASGVVGNFYLAAFAVNTVSYFENDYFQVGGAAQPIGTYQVTVTPTENATYSAVYTDSGDAIEPVNNVYTVVSGKTITITATPAEGFEYASEPDGWTLSEGVITKVVNEAVAIPAPTAKQIIGTYEVVVTPDANATYAAICTNDNSAVVFNENITTVRVGYAIMITATPKENYEYATTPDGWTAGQAGVITKVVDAAGTVAIPAPTVKSSYPTYIDGIEDAEVKAAYEAKYNTWKGPYGADTASAYEAAFLLNIAPDAEDQSLKPASVTLADGKVVITANQNLKNVNGKVYVKAATTLAGLSSANWVEATVDETTGAIKVTPGVSDTAGFYKIKVDF